MHLQRLLEALQPLAKLAGQRIMQVYAMDVQAIAKADGSPVTLADQAADAVIVQGLASIAPHIAVVSEEKADSHALAPPETYFLVDPLDGTKEFLKRDGKGAFTVNIALIQDGAPVAGVVYAPALDRMFAGAQACGAFETTAGVTRRIACKQVDTTCLVAVASESHRDEQTNAWLMQHQVARTTSIGSSLKFCLLAAGEADVYPRFSPTMEWDTAAGDAVLRAAGGIVQHPSGEAFAYSKPGYRNGGFVAWGVR